MTHQLELCEGLAVELGWPVERVYDDNNTTAFRKRSVVLDDGTKAMRVVRPAWSRMLADLRSGVIDSIIVYDSDRLMREPRDLEDLVDIWEASGRKIQFRAQTGSLRMEVDADLLHVRIMVAMANQSSKDTSRRVKAAAVERAQKGQYHGAGAAFGYELVKDPDTQRVIGLREHPAHGAMLRDAYAHLLSGGSLNSIVKRWNEEKRKTSRGNAWRSSPLKRSLMTPTIIGMREYNGELFPADWPALVSRDDWDKLRTLLSDPSRTGKGFGEGPGRGKYVLSGLVKCGGCGRSMVASVYSGGRGARGWVCALSRTKGCTNSSRIAREPLESWVTEAALSSLKTPELQPDEQVSDEHVELRKAINKDHDALRRLEDDYYDGLFDGDRPGFVRQRDRITARIAAKEAQLLDAARSSVLAGIESVESLRANWDTETVARRNSILGAVIDKIVIGKYPAGGLLHG